MTKVIFPIKTETSCLLKWNWSSIYFQSGTTASCHRTQKYKIDPDNFENFHNVPEKIKARNLMLEGKWPGAGCEYCKTVEESGGLSDRNLQLKQLENVNLIPPELHENHTAVETTPTILEVWFSNTCNMSCIYCGPHFSSRWEDENRRHSQTFPVVFKNDDTYSTRLSQHNPHYKKMVKDLWAYLAKGDNAKSIQRYHIVGGEPFLLEETDQSIAFWARHGHPDLIISIISNLNIPHERFKKYIKKFELLASKNKIWQLQLTASLDCWGPEQEYVRHGLDLSLWEQNFEYLLNKHWVSLSVNSVISALTIKSLPQLIEKINHWNLHQEDVVDEWRSYSNLIQHTFITSGTNDDPYILPGDIFRSDFEKILSLMPEDNETQRDHKQLMQGIANKSAMSTTQIEKVYNLKIFLDEIDRRRGTNWKLLFPWLEQIKT
jgi:hypothetical protein